ncbi:MAG: SNF2-related protein [Anaerovoracaceae bacterium]
MAKGEKLQKPNYDQAKSNAAIIKSIDEHLSLIIEDKSKYEDDIRNTSKHLHSNNVRRVLEGLEIEQINTGKKGIRVSSLKEAGISNIWQVFSMSANQLINIRGIGEQSAYKIKSEADSIFTSANRSTPFRISPQTRTGDETRLIQSSYILLKGKDSREKSEGLYRKYHVAISEKLRDSKSALNGLVWFFSSRAKKAQALKCLQDIEELLNGEFKQTTEDIFSEYDSIVSASTNICWENFEANSSAYYAILEFVGGKHVNKDTEFKGIPLQLVAKIEEYPLNLQLMKSTLRNYQLFGTKYILHQKNVLLGDEMGLGKTVQAIAAMAALKETDISHFLVVCPAGVLINWCREIVHHSELHAIKIHGEGLLGAIREWRNVGGIAVTTYETIGKISLPDGFKINMIVADEAHYVKNPNAVRTKALLALMRYTERSVFMTGTPLENNVDEMCFLVGCLQPNVAHNLESIKSLSKAPQFREKLAPVYLRRTRDDVLKELPDLTETEEWCELTIQERDAYYNAVMSGNFMAMRQVSWQISDINYSSKANRLKEICELAEQENRKVIVFSFFRNTIDKIHSLLENRCVDVITGSVLPQRRQEIIDEFADAPKGTVLVSQVQAGGTGLNIQAASVVVLCEPQIKPSIENQAISRTYRMGQTKNVLVYRLLSENSVDERIMEILKRKQNIFDNFADESVVGEANLQGKQKDWMNKIIEEEKTRLAHERIDVI